MHYFPVHRETIISSFPSEKVEEILRRTTYPLSDSKRLFPTAGEVFKFNGEVDKLHFNIFLRINYPQNALPLITGKIETTKSGCIIFLKYKLFFGTAMFLWFWIFLCLLSCLFFCIVTKEYMYAVISGILGFLYYFVMIYNFNFHTKHSINALHEVLNGDFLE